MLALDDWEKLSTKSLFDHCMDNPVVWLVGRGLFYNEIKLKELCDCFDQMKDQNCLPIGCSHKSKLHVNGCLTAIEAPVFMKIVYSFCCSYFDYSLNIHIIFEKLSILDVPLDWVVIVIPIVALGSFTWVVTVSDRTWLKFDGN